MSLLTAPAARKSQLSPERRPGQPLLTLAIPTFNRSPFLSELLQALLPQFSSLPPGTAELLVSDNCSTDGTESVIQGFIRRGLPCRYVKNPANLGADANFLQCLELASGQYVWVFGDDDLLVPNAIADLLSLLEQAEVDLVYLSSFSFSGSVDTAAARREGADKLGRFAEVIQDGRYFLEKVNALIGLISVMLINKNRLQCTPHPEISALGNSNLVQVGWLFPLLHEHTSILFVWQRLVGYRSFNSGGWGICEVFGIRLHNIAQRYFAANPGLADSLMNGVLRYWLCDAILEMRRGRHAEMNQENFAADLQHLFASNWRYWIFIWPVSELPLPLAEAAHRLLSTVNKATRVTQGLWRHLFRRGRYLRPAPNLASRQNSTLE